MISAVVLTREEYPRTLKWCDETIVVADPEPIKDFAAVRNAALAKAKNEWVLFVDDDEEVTPELAKEILDAARMTKYDGYYLPRQDFFFGKWLKFGETGNIKLLRLGKKRAGVWKRKVHEFWDIKNTGTLKNLLLHRPHKSIADFIKKANYYSEIDAREFGYFSLAEVFLKPTGKFFLNYVFHLGFLDGFAGFVMAFMMSFQSLLVRVKQYDLFQTA
jgi:glycosyltransferase involved in cell wall biosynthesis